MLATVSEPSVWVPLAGAALVGLADLDDKLSEDAIADQPLFGEDAADLSDQLRDLSTVAALGAALLAPADSVRARAERVAVNLGVMVAEGAVTTGLKELVGRERPDRLGDRSFPSGHAAQAASRWSLAAHSLNRYALGRRQRRTLQLGVAGLTAATAWARVEGAKHYPSDVLVGVALGNFFANFTERWWYAEGSPPFELSLVPRGDGLAVRLRLPVGF